MALGPVYNYEFFGVNYAPTVFVGEAPKLAQTLLETWVAAWTTANTGVTNYQNGCLLGKTTSTGLMELFDSTKSATAPLKGIFFDETADVNTIATTGVFSNYGIRDGMETLWRYSELIGVNGGTTDIDWLVTNEHATKRTVNGVVCISFGVIGYGA